MPQNDIDKILEEIKKRRQQAQPDVYTEVQAVFAAEKTDTQPAIDTVTEKPQPENHISEQAKATLSRFINNEPDTDISESREFIPEFNDSSYVSKKSEDYIDENFMKFFTQSVIVTKAPEETSNLQIKRKKGFFKRKYITDSLSLNIDALSEDEQEKEKEPIRQKKQRRKTEITKDMPLVKTAGDVYIQALEKEQAPQTAVPEAAKEKVSEPAINIPVPEAAKPQKSASGLNAILGDDKDPESLAKRILAQRRGTQPAPVQTQPVKAVPQEEEITKEIIKPVKAAPTQPAPSEDNSIINSIYTAVIEAQAQDILAAEQMTGFIPQFPEDEETQEEPVVSAIDTEEETEQAEENVFEEYIVQSEFFDREDEESADITQELLDFRQTLSLRMMLGFVCGTILAYMNMAAASGWPVPAFIAPDAQPLLFYIACTVIYLIALISFIPTVLSGFAAVKKAPAPDSLISLGAVMSLAQLVALIVSHSKTDSAEVTIFAAFICLAMGFNAMGKKIATSTIIKNLTLSNAPEGINAGYIVNDTDAVKRLARTLDEKLPKILVSRKTGSITNFVKAGFSIHNSDYTARKLAVASWIVTAVCFVMGLVLSKNICTAIFCAAAASALQIPLSRTLVNSIPSAIMQKNLEKVGALVNGWQGIDQLSKTTHVNFDAKHLFPAGTVILHGIKTFEKERIDLAIIYAASVLIKKCDTLRPVFMNVIEDKTDILYPVDSCEYIERQGYISWINNNRVIIGNRTLMEQYDISMPPLSLEARFTKQNRKPVYLAVGGKLFGMFVVSYRQDEIVKENLEKLVEKGVSVILSSTDFNIDEHLIEEIYGIPSDCVSVLNQKESVLLAQFTDYTQESEACMAHLDSLPSLVAGFCSAESARSAENVCSMIQVASVAIGAVLALMFTWSQTIMHLPLLSLLLMSFGFMGLTMLAAFTKKY